MSPLDRRLHAYRPDLADGRLHGRVEAERFTAGRTAFVAAPIIDLRGDPDEDASIETQLLRGDRVRVFERRRGWAWLQSLRDGYVGYTRASGLRARIDPATHVVAVPRSFVYPRADLKSPPAAAHSMGARLTVSHFEEHRATRYALLADGAAMIARHLRPGEAHADDYVSVADAFLHTPYLWGGTSGFGVDCSGLVQLAMRMCGRDVPRDTDLQARTIGRPLGDGEPATRGDLIFWRGHVAIVADGETVLHANGHTMSVLREPLAEAVRRIEPLWGLPTGRRRPG